MLRSGLFVSSKWNLFTPRPYVAQSQLVVNQRHRSHSSHNFMPLSILLWFKNYSDTNRASVSWFLLTEALRWMSSPSSGLFPFTNALVDRNVEYCRCEHFMNTIGSAISYAFAAFCGYLFTQCNLTLSIVVADAEHCRFFALLYENPAMVQADWQPC